MRTVLVISTGREYEVDLSLAATKKHIENCYEVGKKFAPFDVTGPDSRPVFLRISEIVSVEGYA